MGRVYKSLTIFRNGHSNNSTSRNCTSFGYSSNTNTHRESTKTDLKSSFLMDERKAKINKVSFKQLKNQNQIINEGNKYGGDRSNQDILDSSYLYISNSQVLINEKYCIGHFA